MAWIYWYLRVSCASMHGMDLQCAGGMMRAGSRCNATKLQKKLD